MAKISSLGWCALRVAAIVGVTLVASDVLALDNMDKECINTGTKGFTLNGVYYYNNTDYVCPAGGDDSEPICAASNSCPNPTDWSWHGTIGIPSSQGNGNEMGRNEKSKTADPVEANGVFSISETDISFPGFGIDFEFTRTYSSRINYLGPLGFAWDHSFNASIVSSHSFNGWANCDISVTMLDGHLGAVTFAPPRSDVDPNWYTDPNGCSSGSTSCAAHLYPTSGGSPLQLIYHYSTNSFTVTDFSNGRVMEFTKASFSSDHVLTSIHDLAGDTLTVTWEYPFHKQRRVSQVTDTTGRTIYFKYNVDFLKCLTLTATDTTCSSPLVSYQIDTTSTAADFGELTMVTKGAEAGGTTYKYYSPLQADVLYLSTFEIPAKCSAACAEHPENYFYDPNASMCPFVSECAVMNSYCQSLATSNCVPYLTQYYYQQNCEQCDAYGQNCQPKAADLTDCYDADLDQATSDCQFNPGQYQTNVSRCLLAMSNTRPYCNDPRGCYDPCIQYYQSLAGQTQSGNPLYRFGQPADLNHNIIEEDDPNGNIVVKNNYGSDPTNIGFDRVVFQQWGSADGYRFAYHDFAVEQQYPAGSEQTPSPPDPTNVVPPSSFTSYSICGGCDSGNCGPVVAESGSGPFQQQPAFATVITDPYGTVFVRYFDPLWGLIREVNRNTGETTNYNFDKYRYLSGVARPAGDRTCVTRTALGQPIKSFRIPAPNMLGDSAQHTVTLTYEGPSPFVSSRIEDGNYGYVHYTRLSDGRLSSIETLADDGVTTLKTTYNYDYLTPPISIVAPDGSFTSFDYDPGAAQPRSILTGSGNGYGLFSRYFQYDPKWGHVSESGMGGTDATNSWAVVHTNYDGSGRVSSIQRRLSAQAPWVTTSFSYANGPQPTVIEDQNEQVTPTYDVLNNVVKLVEIPEHPDASHRQTCNHYGPDGRLLETVHPEGDSTLYTYDPAGRVTLIQRGFNPNLPVTDWSLGCAGQHVPPTGDPGLQIVAAFVYGPGGFLQAFEKSGLHYTVTTDGFGRVIEQVDAIGRRMRRGYDLRDRIIWEAHYDASSNVPPYAAPTFADPGLSSATEFQYDAFDRVTQTARWYLEGQTKRITSTSCDDLHRTTTTTEGTRTWSEIRDGSGRVVERIGPDGSTESIQYSPDGLHSLSELQTNFGTLGTQIDRDGLGLVSQVTQGDVIFAEQHNIDGNPISTFKESDGTRTITYDSFKRKTTETRQGAAGAATIIYGWDGNDRRISVTDPNQAATSNPKPTTFVYDGLGRQIQTTDPLGRTTSTTYDGGSNRIATVANQAASLQQTITHDPAGQLVDELTHALGYADIDRQFTYDADGRMLTASISGGLNTDNTVVFEYDSLGRRTSEKIPGYYAYNWGSGVVHTYDLYDTVKTTVVADWQGSTTTHYYDSLRRLQAVDVSDDAYGIRRLATYDYGTQGIGGPQSISYGTGAGTTFTYDGRGRQVAFQVVDPSNNITLAYHQVFGTDGIIRQRQYQNLYAAAPSSDTFQVDSSGRITAESVYQPNVPLLSEPVDNSTVQQYIDASTDRRIYSPDRSGNWTSKTTNTTAINYQFNEINQQVGASDSTTTTYDGLDNLASRSDGGGESYQYNALGWIVSATRGAQQVSYTYDALGRRIGFNDERYSDGRLAWDGDQLLVNGSPTYGWILEVPGADADEHIAGIENLGGGWLWIYHQGPDHSVLAVTEPGGTYLENYSYSAFGEMTVRDWYGDPVPSSVIETKIGFQGQLFEESIGTYWMRSREYNPRIGRFMSDDPIGLTGGVNLYDFVGGNPLSFTDPFGNQKRPISWMDRISVRNWQRVTDCIGGLCDTLALGLPRVARKIIGNSDPNLLNEDSNSYTVGSILAVLLGIKAAASQNGLPADGLGSPRTVPVDPGTPNSASDPTPPPNSQYVGGAYSEVKAPGYEAHHIPADSASTVPTEDGPAVRMDPADHQLTSSYGNSTDAQAYRGQQAQLCGEGRFEEAQQMDIDELRQLFGPKYEAAIQQAVAYTRQLLKRGLIP